MELLIIRHAQSMANISLTRDLDSQLTKEGCYQVSKTATWLKEEFEFHDWQGITSPYFRALQTANRLRKICKIDFRVNDDLREYHTEKVKPLTTDGGLLLPNRSKEFPAIEWNEWGEEKFFANEELEDFIVRVELFLESLDPKGKYVIVSHGATSRVLHDLATGKNLDYLIERYGTIEEMRKNGTSIKNSSLTWVDDGESKWFSKVVHS